MNLDDNDSDDLTLQTPAKRRRNTLICDRMGSEPTRFWFQDGDIVLGVEDKYLKVHRTKLMASPIFSTMLGLPQPESTEIFDGCPLVVLPHDTFHDWIPVMDWMYDRSLFELRSATLDILARALRISTKYEILELRQWCKQQLFWRWPPNILQMNTTAMPNAAEAINLACELDIPEILPAAFYALAVQRWESGRDGGRSHLTLAPDDLRRFIVGREMLQERSTALLVNWDSRANAELYRLCSACQPVCMLSLPEQLMPALHSPYTTWLLHDLAELCEDRFREFDICVTCKATLRHALRQFITQLQVAIPKYFMLQ